uniref:Autophagy-related protein 9 n=1 Tax=Malurus cyaneus samueli TaxID=2593467 RepID=A0A8C5U6G2_9PASS
MAAAECRRVSPGDGGQEEDDRVPEYRRLEDEEGLAPGEEDEEQLLLHVTEGWGWTRGIHHPLIISLTPPHIYHFHQRNGFACVLLSDILELVQFLFVVTFSTFLLCCVDYDVLFATRPLNHSHVPERAKVTLPDAVLPAPQCARRLRGTGWLLFLLVLAGAVWLCRLVTALRRLVGYWEIRSFYIRALGIPALCNHSWQSVQARLLALQRRQPLCVPRRELTELDIHHRILRFRNYTVAMVNKSLLPVRFRLPLLGPVVFLTRGLQFNLELLLFRGPAALFQNTWSLRPQVKRAGARRALARGLARAAVLLGVANLALCPCVLGWRLLLAFFSYAEGLKRAPGSLGARRWSLYARHYLRHFNELGHELQARLSRGHAPATKYMDSFSSPLLAVLARHVGFFAGSVLAVLIVLTVYDEDVLTVQHILTAITLLGLVVTVARSFIPDEHAVWCPEQLLQRVLAHVHYLPEHWQGFHPGGAAEPPGDTPDPHLRAPPPRSRNRGFLPQLHGGGGGGGRHLLLRAAGRASPRQPPGGDRGDRGGAFRGRVCSAGVSTSLSPQWLSEGTHGGPPGAPSGAREDGAVVDALRSEQSPVAAAATCPPLPRPPAGAGDP